MAVSKDKRIAVLDYIHVMSREDLPTDERLRQFDPDRPDMGLYLLLFQYGWYFRNL